MYKLGITGYLASGKSTVLSILTEYGWYTLDCDLLVKRIYQESKETVDEVTLQFGNECLMENGKIDTKSLAKVVFNDDVALQRLEEIIWKPVKIMVKNEIEIARKRDFKKFAIEGIKLIQSSIANNLNEIWIVTSNSNLIAENLAKSDRSFSINEATNLLQSQKKSLEIAISKKENSKYKLQYIENLGSIMELRKKVATLLERIDD